MGDAAAGARCFNGKAFSGQNRGIVPESIWQQLLRAPNEPDGMELLCGGLERIGEKDGKRRFSILSNQSRGRRSVHRNAKEQGVGFETFGINYNGNL